MQSSYLYFIKFSTLFCFMFFLSACGGSSDKADEKDLTPPQLSLVGSDAITIQTGEIYIESGASAVDNLDGDVAIVVHGSVDNTMPGEYILTYIAIDKAGNEAKLTRVVFVVDLTPPDIKLNEEIVMTVGHNTIFMDPGATAEDKVDGYVEITSLSTVDTSKLGTYEIVYQASDKAGNTSEKTRTIEVVDISKPSITLLGANHIEIVVNLDYEELGATAFDVIDGEIPVEIDNSELKPNEVGIYEIFYSATDQAGNLNTIIRTVTVREFHPFIMEWQTTNQNKIEFFVSGDSQNFHTAFTVDWGDGTLEQYDESSLNFYDPIQHTYDQSSTYEIRISGKLPGIKLNNAQNLIKISQWGDIPWQTMESSFSLTQGLKIVSLDNPDLSQTVSMQSMFEDCETLEATFENWNTSKIENMSNMFANCDFKGDITEWDTSRVKNMSYMFSNSSEFNQDIAQWDVANVENMEGLFFNSKEFNQDISEWNVLNVKNMNSMFFGAESFNRNISDWVVSNVEDMSLMFSGSFNFNQNINSWDVSSVKNMTNMFSHAQKFNYPLYEWEVENVENMSEMFNGAYAFNQDLSDWDVSNVKNMDKMFYVATAFNQDLGSWNIENTSSMADMLKGATLSTKNYSNTLISWSQKSPKNFVEFNGGFSTYSDQAESARSILVNTYHWRIEDNGKQLE